MFYNGSIETKPLGKYQFSYMVVFGILAPLLCIILDPIVFDNILNLYMNGMLGYMLIAASLLIGISIPTLIIWLWGVPASAIMVGVLYTGALGSISIGVLIFTMSLSSIQIFIISYPDFTFFGIGFFGLVPIFTAYAYFLAATYERQRLEINAFLCKDTIVISTTVVVLVAFFAISQIVFTRFESQQLKHILDNDHEAIVAAERLAKVSWFVETYQLGNAYITSKNRAYKDQLATSFKIITGDDIVPYADFLEKIRD